jgi:hypothetical protein
VADLNIKRGFEAGLVETRKHIPGGKRLHLCRCKVSVQTGKLDTYCYFNSMHRELDKIVKKWLTFQLGSSFIRTWESTDRIYQHLTHIIDSRVSYLYY